MDDGEFRRRRRRIQWMLTAHSSLARRYRWASQLTVLLAVALSVVGLMFALADGDQEVSAVGLSLSLQTLLATLSAGTLLVSLLDLIFGWSRAAADHGDSFRVLAELNSLYSGATKTDDEWLTDGVDLGEEYDRAMARLTVIPDRFATRSKVRQNRKKDLFARSDANPGAPLWLLRIQRLVGARKQSQRNGG